MNDFKDRERTVGVLGYGFVGRAVAKHFDKFNEVNVYDKFDGRDREKQAAYNSDVVFVCVPTPTVEGFQDCTAMDDVMFNASGRDGVFVVKSTVLPGTCDRYVAKDPTLCLVHNPEFLTARTAEEDFRDQQYILLGGTDNTSASAVPEVEHVYRQAFPDVPIYSTTALVTETVKYMANTFYATKLSYMNEIKLLCDDMGIEFSEVRELVLKQGWINPMHTEVPGPDGRLGWGGACFPKDTRALVGFMEGLGLDATMLRAALEKNRKLRPDV